MKVVGLQAQNVKALKSVSIEPGDENVVVIAGANGAGKSSVLDSIAYAIGGKRLCPPQPIRNGEASAEISVDLGELKVTRRWTQGGTKIVVEDQDGHCKSPQQVLDKMHDLLAFDLLSFLKLGPKDQCTKLLEVLGLGDKLDEIDAKIGDANQAATSIKRDIEMHILNAKEEEANVLPDTPDELVSMSHLTAEMDAAHKQIRDNEDDRRDVERKHGEGLREAKLDLLKLDVRIESLTKQLDEARQLRIDQANFVTDCEEAYKAAIERVAGLVDPDTMAISRKIEEADQMNISVRAKRAAATHLQQAGILESKLKAERQKLTSLRDERQDLLKNAKWPVDGMSVNSDGNLTLNSVPFVQASQAEQLRAAIGLAMSTNPDLRVVLLRDGSLLDDGSMQIVRDLAEQHDFQVWVERVGSDGPCTVLIEDGSVVSDA
jgi:DNA repair exonuclease SbcCD ATPase subunit